MNAKNANLLNALCLIGMGAWGFIDTNGYTALIPAGFGLVLLVCQKGVNEENKIIAHVAVTLTLLILLALVGMRLPKSIDKGGVGLYRVLSMVITSAIAMVLFVKSFIDARKNKS